MDFTLDWEHLGLDQGDLFWDTALDNYQNIFLLSEYPLQLWGPSHCPTQWLLSPRINSQLLSTKEQA